MARINLLPWREELRKRQQREFGYMIAAGVALSLLLITLAHILIQGWIGGQIERNDLLKREIVLLDEKIKEIRELEKVKGNLISRMEVIQQLQTSRPQIVHLFDEIINVLPDGSYVTELTQEGTAVTLKGRAQSNARVSALMRGIDKSQWLTKPSLDEIASSERGNTGLFTFKLKMEQTSPKAEEKEQ
ncbi:MAG: PilN domain-containing protein [Gammaproteobacteria bacterium]|nr:PilN domain-containing protein [Gammaproteobacteria bacterium]MBU1653797.1 PilN domain-containing protein [Gammaproteobacteria bacterium]MBU1961709.1 PilN domain-containing protein [Gammaproteobacteria bacterium]